MSSQAFPDNPQPATDKPSDTAASMTDDARNFAEQQRRSGAYRFGNAARAVHRAADEIGQQSPMAGRYMHGGADQLERASRALHENSLDELYQMASRFAHEQPLAFIGGTVAAGLLLARVLRSSRGSMGGGEMP